MTKKEWLRERVFVDEYGRPYNLSDVPMTSMIRSEAYEKQRFDDKKINKLYQEDMEDLEKIETIIMDGC
jgi:hypothetical protein